MPSLSIKELQKLNKTQIFLFKQICKVLFNRDVGEFIKDECVNYAKVKDALFAKHPNDTHLKVWDLVAKYYGDEQIVLSETKKLSLPLAFNCVVCFHQKEFKG